MTPKDRLESQKKYTNYHHSNQVLTALWAMVREPEGVQLVSTTILAKYPLEQHFSNFSEHSNHLENHVKMEYSYSRSGMGPYIQQHPWRCQSFWFPENFWSIKGQVLSLCPNSVSTYVVLETEMFWTAVLMNMILDII